MERLTRAQVAKLTGAGQKLLRHYEDKGILHPEESGCTTNTYHYYTPKEIMRVLDIQVYRELGYNSADIKAVFESPDYDWEESLDKQIEELQEKRRRLKERIELAKFLKSTVGHSGERQESFDTFLFLVKFPKYRWVLGLLEDDDAIAYYEAKFDAAAMFMHGFVDLEISQEDFIAEISRDGMTTDEGELTAEGLIHVFTMFENRCDEALGGNAEAQEMPLSAFTALVMALAVCSESFDYASPEAQALIGHAYERMRTSYSGDALMLLREWANLVGPEGVEAPALTDDIAFMRKVQRYASEAILHWLANNKPEAS